jgi:hypothetical protein
MGAGPSHDGLMPMPAQVPTGPRASTRAAYGLGAGPGDQASTAFLGTTGAAVAAAVLLLALWWSLPR